MRIEAEAAKTDSAARRAKNRIRAACLMRIPPYRKYGCIEQVEWRYIILHFYPGNNPLELACRKLVELDEVRRQLLDCAEYPPDRVHGGDILDAVENDFFRNV